MKNLCLLVRDGHFFGLDHYDPPVTKNTRVVKASSSVSGHTKLASWPPHFNHLIIIGCAVAATTKPLKLDNGTTLSGNGPGFCQGLANALQLTVHASTKDMRLHAWNTPDDGDDVMAWTGFIKKAGQYVSYSS